jgi:diguanylate cyclase (GGDEF)-like protein
LAVTPSGIEPGPIERSVTPEGLKRAGYVAAALSACVLAGAVWRFWPGAVTLIASQNYLPHGVCYLWNRQLLSLHVFSDSIIFFSYMSISISLAWLVYSERGQLPFRWVFGAFGLFIVACGFTHAMDVVVLWAPLYWLAGDVKLITAVASLTTAVALPLLVPDIRRVLQQANIARWNERRYLASSNRSTDVFYVLASVRNGAGELVDFRFVFVDPNSAQLVSGTREIVLGGLLCEQYPENRLDGSFEQYRQVVETSRPLELELPPLNEDGKEVWVCLQVNKLDDGIVMTTSNITARKDNELNLAKLAAYTRSILASSPSAMIVTDVDGTITSVNPAAERMLLYGADDLIGRETPLIFLDPGEVAGRAAALAFELNTSIEPGISALVAKVRHGLADETEWTFVRRDGFRFDARLMVSALNVAEGGSSGFILVADDITERKRVERHVVHLAHHDALTGLPTRTLLHDRLQVALARAERDKDKVGLLMVDLDNFKQVNDLMGHLAGDQLLAHVAQRLQSAVRAADTVARMGGDEFVVVLDHLHTVDEAHRIAEKLLAELQTPIAFGRQTIASGASIGVCVYPDDAGDAEAMLKYADSAMYLAKGKGRRGFQRRTERIGSPILM